MLCYYHVGNFLFSIFNAANSCANRFSELQIAGSQEYTFVDNCIYFRLVYDILTVRINIEELKAKIQQVLGLTNNH